MNRDETIMDSTTNHIELELLLLFAENELPQEEIVQIDQHLHGCEQCRTELERAQETLNLHSDYFHQTAIENPPPNEWRAFEGKLKAYAASFEQRSSERPESTIAFLQEHEPKSSRWKDFVSWMFSAPRLSVSLAGAAAAVALAVFLQHPRSGWLMPTEIVNRAEAAQERAVQSIPNPVLYQKVKLQHASSEPVTLESWNDIGASRIKQTSGTWWSLTDRSKTESDKSAPPLVRELKTVYTQNHLAWGTPISLSSFTQWRSSISTKPESETVAELNLPNGGKAYRIRSEAAGAGPEHRIQAIEIVVRERDWHAVSENLVVAERRGSSTYEIAELDYKVLPLSGLSGNFWGENSDVSSGVVSDSSSVHSTNMGELLIDALSRLDRVNALTQEQLTVKSQPNQGLLIQGVVTNENRKAQILDSLGPLANNTSVKIDIDTASSDSKARSGIQSKLLQVQSIDIPSGDSTSNPDLRRYLQVEKQLSGSALEQAMDHFTTIAVDHSIQAQLHSLALSQIANAVLPSEQSSLGLKVTQEWRSMMVRHAEQIERDATSLRDQLAPLFKDSVDKGGSASLPVPGESLQSAASRLAEITSRNNNILWNAFSVNTTDTANRALADPSYKRALDAELQLASAIRRQLTY